VLVVLAATGCANAGHPGSGGGGDDAPNGKVDASVKQDSNVTPTDTPPPIDAPGPVDAAVDSPTSMLPDAPQGPFCSSNSQCTVSGECCVTLGGPMGFCAPGTVVAGQCFPSN
jgi:hypothetical protein